MHTTYQNGKSICYSRGLLLDGRDFHPAGKSCSCIARSAEFDHLIFGLENFPKLFIYAHLENISAKPKVLQDRQYLLPETNPQT
jgi:hypothetical protein